MKQYLRSFYKNNHLLYLLTVLLAIVSTVIPLFDSWLLGNTFDVIVSGSFTRLTTMLALAALSTAAGFLLGAAMDRLKTRFLRRALAQYKSLVFRQISDKSISAFMHENTSRYLSALTNDMVSIEENYLNHGILILYHSALFVLTLGMMLFYSWELTVATIVFSAFPILVSLLMGKRLTAQEKKVSDCNERYVGSMKDLLGGFAVIKSFKAERQARKLFDDANETLETERERRRWWEALLMDMAQGCASLVQFALLLLSAWFAMNGQITAGTVLIFTNLANFVLQPINIVPPYIASRQAAKGLIKKHAEIIQENAERRGKAIAPVLRDAIELKDLSFSYGEDTQVLHNIDLRFESGKCYALVGGSGAGKSTLLNLLMGASDDYTGAITIDGQELRDIDTDSLYALEGLIGQNVFLFDDTIQKNITMFSEFPAERIGEAVKQSGLDALIAEKGADYPCGENGAGLSGGERQRVSIARCLLRRTPVLLVDEATAALDAKTAAGVTDAILKLENTTRIVVTHRLEAGQLRRYDEIIVLKNGVVSEKGDFDTLMEQRGQLYSLYTVANG